MNFRVPLPLEGIEDNGHRVKPPVRAKARATLWARSTRRRGRPLGPAALPGSFRRMPVGPRLITGEVPHRHLARQLWLKVA
jgi:hypothetical protein